MTDHILPEASSVAGGPSAVRHEDHSGRLAQNALGLSGVLFCIVTGAAPIAAMLFNVPVAVLGGGFAAPAAFLVANDHPDDLRGRLHRDGPRGDRRGRLLLVRDPRLRTVMGWARLR